MTLRSIAVRTALLVFGTLLGLAVLECALIGASHWAQARRADVEAAGVGSQEVRILCVGESTTQGAWWTGPKLTYPQQLEDLLRAAQPNINFRVINEGIIGTTSAAIVYLLGDWLERHDPHIVIAMMGINDEGNVLVYESPGAPAPPSALARLRTYKLARLLWRTWTADAPNAKATSPVEAPRPPAPSPEVDQLQKAFALAYEHFRYSEVLDLKRELVAIDPGTPVYHYGVMRGIIADYPSAQDEARFFANVLGADLASLSLPEQEKLLTRFCEANPDEFAAYRSLSNFYFRVGAREQEEEALLTRALERPAIAGYAALRLAQFHRARGRPERDREWIELAVARLPQDSPSMMLAGDFAFRGSHYALAARLYEEGLARRATSPVDLSDLEYRQIAVAHFMAGDEARAREYFTLDAELSLQRFKETTQTNYVRLAQMVRAHGAQLVAMQYPMTSVWPLKKMLADQDDVVFIDNEETFRTALAEHDYGHFFVDQFAGSFGHMRAEGNALLARNLAPIILELAPQALARPRGNSGRRSSPTPG